MTQRKRKQYSQSSASGFTLVEIAIVLVIVGLLLGGLLMPLATQVDTQRIADTRETLNEINEALIGYALRNFATGTQRPFLPCPDTNDDGVEEPRVAGACPNLEGRIPWVTLGVTATDSWGNRFRYRVLANFSNGINGFTLTTAAAPAISVCSSSAGCPGANAIATPVVAVVLSHGKNGFGAFNQSGGTNPLPAGVDELENRNSNTSFVSRTITSFSPPPCDGAGQPSCEFDDVVTWLSPNVLMTRIAAANRAL